jgi:nanoRNase/pAp phosphatase (c-di-AMP/oligoRNAs hydrolase)
MPTDQNPKQLVAQRLKDANNILVTVGRNPGVDDLSAALALTLILDKLGKTPTAVFSGKIPPAIEFLEPGKTFDTNVDGLRDFIIALDKEKADRLRYKVEDDVVRVFITPYKTTITEKDLTFSQGDFNVDLIVAFGVEKREDLDAAITAHGRILHDAAVITIDQFPGGSSLGEIDWNDTEASSLSEMLMSLTEALQSGIIDQPIATAILTGLVSSTDRFRNEKTSPKVMTMAAQLMAAGANQQLIAEKLEEATTVTSGKLNGDAQQPDQAPEEAADQPAKSNDGEMKVEHGETPSSEDGTKDAADRKADEVAGQESAEAVKEAEDELKGIADTQLPTVQAEPESAKAASWRDRPVPEPSIGGTLNATTEEAEEANRNAEDDTKNHVILSHDEPVLGEQGSGASVLNATSLPPTEPSVSDIFTEFPVSDGPAPQSPSVPSQPAAAPAAEPALAFEETPIATPPTPTPSVTQTNPTLADLEQQVKQQEAAAAPVQGAEVDPLEHARAAVDAALNAQPFDPAGQPLAATGAQPLGAIDRTIPTPEVSPAPTFPAPEPFAVPTTPEQPVSPAAPVVPMPPLPPLPDFSTLPPLPGEVPAPSGAAPAMPSFGLPEEPQSTVTPSLGVPPSSDPGQFKLPGAP